MNMEYLLYDAAGLIVQSVFGPLAEVEACAERMGLGLLESPGGVRQSSSFVRDGAVIDLGPAPSPFHVIQDGSWVDPRSIDALRAARWEGIKSDRARAEAAPLEFDGHVFDADAASQAKIAGAVQMASLAGGSFAIDWTLADNTTVTLSAASMVGLGIALGTRSAQVYAIARGLRTQVEAATTREQLDAIVWPAGQA